MVSNPGDTYHPLMKTGARAAASPWRAGGLAAALVLGACGAESTRPLGLPEDDLFFPAAGALLHYALDLPAGAGPFPAVVIGHGSGRATKAEGAAFVPFWNQRGYAVLRFDKRGVGRSTGLFMGVSSANSDTQVELLADDMLAGVAFLRGRGEIDSSRIGLMGVSQAGWIMVSAASRSSHVRFFVAVVGSVLPVGVNIFYEGLRDRPIDEAYLLLERYAGPRGWDPLPALRRTSAPALWLLGEEDRLVPTRHCLPILAELRHEGRPSSVRVYPGLGHDLGGRGGYLSDVAAWLDTEGLR